MSEMVKKVAAAMFEDKRRRETAKAAGGVVAWAPDMAAIAEYRALARAAIEAMREPTEEMVDAARSVGPVVLVRREVGEPYARSPLAEEMRAMNAAMIQAALSNSPERA